MFGEFFESFKSSIKDIGKSDVEVMKEYIKGQFIDGNDFYEQFPESVAIALKRDLSDELRDIHEQNVSILCMCVKKQYLALWLLANDYGEKLALKSNLLIYKDSYGDYVFDDWFKEVVQFTGDRIYNITSFLDTNIPEKFKRLARNNDCENFLTGITDEYTTMSDIVEDISNDIESLAVLFIPPENTGNE